jgi:hypothetical protein
MYCELHLQPLSFPKFNLTLLKLSNAKPSTSISNTIMGTWGPYLIESDDHYDIVDHLVEDAGIELLSPKDLEAARAHLNKVGLERLFETYVTASDEKFHCSKTLRFVILGTLMSLRIKHSNWQATGFLAMRIGATFKLEHMELLRGICGKGDVPEKYAVPMLTSAREYGCELREVQLKQFTIAVRHYKNNGKPYRDTS